MEFKIKSITDVITNSSTEVFTIYNDDSINKIKELFNTLITSSDKNVTFDDLFQVEYDINDDYLLEYYDEYLTANNLAEELLKWNKLVDSNGQYDYFYNLPTEIKQKVIKYVEGNGYCEIPFIDGYTIKLKENKDISDKPYYEKIASLLSGLDNIFVHEVRYC